VSLSANLDWNMSSSGTAEDRTTIQLELPNGNTETPVNDFSSLTDRFDKNPVFETPADVEKATMVLHARVSVGSVGPPVTARHKGKRSVKLAVE